MSLGRYLLVFCLFISAPLAQAQEGCSSGNTLGLNVALGFPFIIQGGANYRFSDQFGLSLNYGQLDLSVGDAKAKLSMPEILFHYHPFSGAFYLGAGIGKESLEVSATDDTTGNQARAEVDAMTTIIKLGWMWGAQNGGFWFGMDLSYIIPNNPDSTITAPGVPQNDPAYTDVVDAADEFGETAYLNITFARFGWLF